MARHVIDSGTAIKDLLAKLPDSIRSEIYGRLLLLAGEIQDVRNKRAAEQVAALFGGRGRDTWDVLASFIRVCSLLDVVFDWPISKSPEEIARTAKRRKVELAVVKAEVDRAEHDFEKAAEQWRKFRASKMRNEDLIARIERADRAALMFF